MDIGAADGSSWQGRYVGCVPGLIMVPLWNKANEDRWFDEPKSESDHALGSQVRKRSVRWGDCATQATLLERIAEWLVRMNRVAVCIHRWAAV